MKRTLLKARYRDRELRAILARLAEMDRDRALVPEAQDRIDYDLEEVVAAGAEMGADRSAVEQAIVAAEAELESEQQSVLMTDDATPAAAPPRPGRLPKLAIPLVVASLGAGAAAILAMRPDRVEMPWAVDLRVFAAGDRITKPDWDLETQLRRFVETLRSVSADTAQTTAAMTSTLAMVTGPARRAVFAESIANSPTGRAATGLVSVELEQVEKVEPGDNRTWLVHWRENITDPQGGDRGFARWVGTFRLRSRTPEDQATGADIKLNPLGILIEAFEIAPAP
jgi:type IV secretory pathway TrbF-like protein